jgi:precorrin-6B methylase 2
LQKNPPFVSDIFAAKSPNSYNGRRKENQMPDKWTKEEILNIAKGYQKATLLFAAADLDIFTTLNKKPMTAKAISAELDTDYRATSVLLDALVAMALLTKQNAKYSVTPAAADLLCQTKPQSVLPMVRHHANCHRRWVQLPQITKSGKPVELSPSIRGQAADNAVFIGAMENSSRPVAAQIVEKLQPLSFRNLLDIGAASGTWTIAFLNALPKANATLFDLPDVIPMAEKRIAQAKLSDRVKFVPGDFYSDDLPPGADFAWLSAIAHQNSRSQNRELFAKIYHALQPHGTLVLRDIVMEKSRTQPPAGALFAVNMLVATEGGGTYTFEEYRSDLLNAGFKNVTLIARDEFMNSLIHAKKT